MPVYRITFEARIPGPLHIGKRYTGTIEIEADTPADAKQKIHDTIETIHIISVTDTATGQTIYVV